MPYIDDNWKRGYLDGVAEVLADRIENGGQLNYFICRLLVRLNPEGYHEMRANTADIREALHEYRRKVMAPYEDEKEIENGTVWEEDHV